MLQHIVRSKTSRRLWFLLVVIVFFERVRHRSSIVKQPKAQTFEQSVHDFEATLKLSGNGHTPNGALIYHVCPEICDTKQAIPLNVSRRSRVIAKIHNVIEAQVQDESSLDLYDPPIPIIGTDQHSARNIYATDVATFHAHVNIWRDVFHGSSDWAFVFSCRVSNVEQIISKLLAIKAWDRMTSTWSSHEFEWDMIMLSSAQSQEPTNNSGEDRVENVPQIHLDDVHAYALNKRGSDVLLSHTKAFTLPLSEFLDVVLKHVTEFKVGRMRAISVSLSDTCEKRTRFVASNFLPFYPPLHWTYTKSRHPKVTAMARRGSLPVPTTGTVP